MNMLRECEECGARAIAVEDVFDGALVVCAECDLPRGTYPGFFQSMRERIDRAAERRDEFHAVLIDTGTGTHEPTDSDQWRP